MTSTLQGITTTYQLLTSGGSNKTTKRFDYQTEMPGAKTEGRQTEEFKDINSFYKTEPAENVRFNFEERKSSHQQSAVY